MIIQTNEENVAIESSAPLTLTRNAQFSMSLRDDPPID